MEDLQNTVRSILSDPARMAQVAALAESLGLKPPEEGPDGDTMQKGRSERGEAFAAPPVPPPSAQPGPELPELGRLIGLLSASSGAEEQVLNALRPSLSPEGRGRVERALRAAKLSRLAGQFLAGRGEAHV